MVTKQDMYFSWVLPDMLAGCRAPWREAEARFLKDHGIELLIRLQEEERLRMSTTDLSRVGILDYHFPMPDGGASPPEQTQVVVEVIHDALLEGRPVAISCGGGIGRTGTVLACYFVAHGVPAQEAIPMIRGVRSPSIETPEQERAVHAYEGYSVSTSALAPGIPLILPEHSRYVNASQFDIGF